MQKKKILSLSKFKGQTTQPTINTDKGDEKETICRDKQRSRPRRHVNKSISSIITHRWRRDEKQNDPSPKKRKKAIRQSEANGSRKMGPGPGRPLEANIWAAGPLVSAACIARGSKCSRIKFRHLSPRLVSDVGGGWDGRTPGNSGNDRLVPAVGRLDGRQEVCPLTRRARAIAEVAALPPPVSHKLSWENSAVSNPLAGREALHYIHLANTHTHTFVELSF